MYYTDDPIADYERYDADRERALGKLPRCCDCGEYIQDEEYYDIDDNLFCEKCLNNNFKKLTENYSN